MQYFGRDLISDFKTCFGLMLGCYFFIACTHRPWRSIRALNSTSSFQESSAFEKAYAAAKNTYQEQQKKQTRKISQHREEFEDKIAETEPLNRTLERQETPVWPLEKAKLSSMFGPRWGRWHEGIDLSAPRGSIVKAALSGKVIYAASKLPDYGNMIVIRHQNQMVTIYAHNQKNLVSEGEMVEQGQVVAYVGATGAATGPHLHFEVRDGITPLNPLEILPRN